MNPARLDISNPQIAAAWLGAFIDGEGTVQARLIGNRKAWVRNVQIANQDEALIRVAVRCCKVLGIDYGVYPRRTNGFSQAEILILCIMRRRSFEILYEQVPISSLKKRQALRTIIKSYRQDEPYRSPRKKGRSVL